MYCERLNRVGPYKFGVFKFILSFPDIYPALPPAVQFTSEVYHPLISHNGILSLRNGFPKWIPGQHYVFHLLHYIKNSFRTVVLDILTVEEVNNEFAWMTYNGDRKLFSRLAQQSVDVSLSPTVIGHDDGGMIVFQGEASEEKQMEILELERKRKNGESMQQT
ncbi:Protein crossbronx [Neolecta irregularis DAH-3]|uniref:Protein crossbronx n=1 Tax=Neolecta irregularis (strain DAH-3) TaxID=1198029 RepID=A0A1U7LLB0_NEOID|nr:Protein crossbronx [Neolecta irregularis DAH-3]|eukprot:OLL23429.1 Protein crossbronx [Neolecta irregularis DAH-3]